MKTTFFFIFCVFLFTYSNAQENTSVPGSLEKLNPINIFPKNPGANFYFGDANSKTQPSIFKAKGDKKEVFEAEVFKALPMHYSVQAIWRNVSPVKKGDVLMARFDMRCLYSKQETGKGEVNFYLEDSKTYDKSVSLPLSVNSTWKTFNIPFVALFDMPTGQASICFSFGALAQKIEFKNIEVLNFEQKIKKENLPETKFTYSGRENDAPWRREALKRIDELRKAQLVIKVVDRNGHPIKNATVTAKLIKSKFLFGTAVSAPLLASASPTALIYKEKVKQLFNTVVMENGLKWRPWINTQRQLETKKAVDWILQNHLNLRGHNLVWPSQRFTPGVYKTPSGFVDGFQDSIDNHIIDVANYAKGKVIAWDVINEMLHETDYFKTMPRTEAAHWFKLIKKIDPKAQLFLNDYGMLNDQTSPTMIGRFIALVKELKSYGAPVEALGVQAHLGRQPRNPTDVISDLNLLSDTGLPIQITEFDIDTPDEQLQADYTRDFLIACFSHPAITGFTMWGFWEGVHWKPNAAMFRKNWTEKPNEKVWKDLVTKQWITSFSKKSDSLGLVKERAFLGDYEVAVEYKKVAPLKKVFTLTKKGDVLTVVIP